jgi:hypothetical protein
MPHLVPSIGSHATPSSARFSAAPIEATNEPRSGLYEARKTGARCRLSKAGCSHLMWLGWDHPMNDAWIFGTNQLLTSIGFLITIAIAVASFKTFNRWKREKIEERRIEAAIDILALAYESRIVFRRIRAGLITDADLKDMPVRDGEDADHRRLRGSYWAYLKRVIDHRDFFERAWDLQPVAMAIFGEAMADVFAKLHETRASIEVSSEKLANDPTAMGDRQLAMDMRTDLVGHPNKAKDRVQQSLDAFCNGIERVCKPIVDSEVRPLSLETAAALLSVRFAGFTFKLGRSKVN